MKTKDIRKVKEIIEKETLKKVKDLKPLLEILDEGFIVKFPILEINNTLVKTLVIMKSNSDYIISRITVVDKRYINSPISVNGFSLNIFESEKENNELEWDWIGAGEDRDFQDLDDYGEIERERWIFEEIDDDY